MKTLIIAEAGVNHNGDLALARRLIEVAADAGADLVKFQTFQADKLVAISAPQADYQTRNTGIKESQHAMIRRLELDLPAHQALLAHCQACNIEFFSSAFDLDSLRMLAGLGLKRWKIPPGEITNLPYLRQVGAYRQPVVLSSGMSTLTEIGAALAVLEQAGTPRRLITVLHCNTEYPTPMADVNLRAMLSIRDAFNVEVGYSDHTDGIEVATAAVALGATVIEKHFTLDRSLPGPDHKASLEPQQLKAMVTAIRNIEVALGSSSKKPSASEQKNMAIARKSIVAARAIAKGEILTADNLAVKRPGTGISPMQWDALIGQRAVRDFAADELLEP
jgi:N,N'-diacetyllegionaminate synthase